MRAMTDLDSTPSPVVWPKWCYSSTQVDSEAQDLALNNNTLSIKDKEHTASIAVYGAKGRAKKPRREQINGIRHPQITQIPPPYPTPQEETTTVTSESSDVKCERLSPETPSSSESHSQTTITSTASQGTPSPSASPKSPASHRTRTPSYPGTPPNPAFTPPTNIHPGYERFSPAALSGMPGMQGGSGAIKQMESFMNRNCSELMRSLAARYNNSNPNERQSRPPGQHMANYFSNPNNGFFKGGLSGLPGFRTSQAPFLGTTSSPTSVSCQPIVTSVVSKENENKIDTPITATSGIPPNLPPPGAPPLFPATAIPGFPPFPLVDVSSTQVLLNMVRNASATPQSQLENYLRGAIKRPADNSSSPLDLSASVAAKRPRTDVQKGFDMKNLFNQHIPEDDKKCDPYAKVIPSNSPPLKTRPSISPGASKTDLPCTDKNCTSIEATSHWTVEDVCSFVGSIDLCAEYVEAFREQRIDGSALPLLTEDHLTSGIKMKLGPALKLRSVLARRLGACNVCLHCDHCHSPVGDRRPSSASGQ